MKLRPALLLLALLPACTSPAPPPPTPASAPLVFSGDGQISQPQAPGREGFTTTASGLQYKMLKPGTGRRPTPLDTVTVHYRGTLLDGTEFDSSYKRNEPASFPLTGVIKGWTEGLQLMQEGSTYEFIIPSHLAYGAQGAPPAIGPNQTLNFVVELLQVQ